jgi:hypothetical protein
MRHCGLGWSLQSSSTSRWRPIKGVGKTGRLLGDAAAVILRASPDHSSAPAGWIEVEQDTNKISKRVNVPGCHRNSL